jgi:Fe-S cluster assembly protein SufD
MIGQYQLENTPTHQLVFVDGYFDATLSTINQLPEGVILSSLNEALLHQPEYIEPHLSENENPSSCALINLNTAFMSDGFFLYVPKNTALAHPIHLLFLTTHLDNNTLLNNRNIILLAENSTATLLEQHVALSHLKSTEHHLIKNSFTTVETKENAQLHYYKLQQEHAQTIHLAHTEVQQSRDSQVISYSISLGSKLARDDLHVKLNGTGASCELNGFYALSDKQHTDHHTRIDHYYPHGDSRECYKGILKDHAKGVFNGKVIVHPQAQKTNSEQLNKNLLLSNTAEMNTKPELEIYADDVKCTHGSTVGQIEPDTLFYLRSRGLDEAEATTLLVHAFYDDILQRMKNSEISHALQLAVTKKIENLLLHNL